MSNIFKCGGGSTKFEGTATVSQVLDGATFYSSDKELKTGDMPNNGTVSQTLNAGSSYTIPAGYHNGSGKVTANSLASQTSADATASHILTGRAAWVNGVKIEGSIPKLEGRTIIPTTSSQTITAGNYINGAQIIKGDANLVSANIKSGVSIFGVNGSYSGSITTYLDGTLKDLGIKKLNFVSKGKFSKHTDNKLGTLLNSYRLFEYKGNLAYFTPSSSYSSDNKTQYVSLVLKSYNVSTKTTTTVKTFSNVQTYSVVNGTYNYSIKRVLADYNATSDSFVIIMSNSYNRSGYSQNTGTRIFRMDNSGKVTHSYYTQEASSSYIGGRTTVNTGKIYVNGVKRTFYDEGVSEYSEYGSYVNHNLYYVADNGTATAIYTGKDDISLLTSGNSYCNDDTNKVTYTTNNGAIYKLNADCASKTTISIASLPIETTLGKAVSWRKAVGNAGGNQNGFKNNVIYFAGANSYYSGTSPVTYTLNTALAYDLNANAWVRYESDAEYSNTAIEYGYMVTLGDKLYLTSVNSSVADTEFGISPILSSYE